MMQRPLRKAVVVALTAGAAIWPTPCPAQVEIAPLFGLYVPLGEWTQESDGGTGFYQHRHQISAAIVGARVAVWTSKRWALEGTFAFTPSQVAVSTSGQTNDITAGVLLASARAEYRLATLADGDLESNGTRWDILLGAGAGLVKRGGSAWENTRGTTAPTILLSGSIGTHFDGAVTFRFGMEDYISWAQFDRGLPSQTRAELHHDLVVSLGVVVRVGGQP